MKSARDAPADAASIDCKAMVAARHVKQDAAEIELAKRLRNPAAYQ